MAVTACQRLLNVKCEQPITTVDVLPKNGGFPKALSEA